MLDVPPLWAVTSTNYYSCMKDKYPTIYVISSCIFTRLKFNDMNEQEVKEKTDILCQILTSKAMIQYKEVTRDISDNYVSTFVIFKWFGT